LLGLGLGGVGAGVDAFAFGLGVDAVALGVADGVEGFAPFDLLLVEGDLLLAAAWELLPITNIMSTF
jgi:hypothetical protein